MKYFRCGMLQHPMLAISIKVLSQHKPQSEEEIRHLKTQRFSVLLLPTHIAIFNILDNSKFWINRCRTCRWISLSPYSDMRKIDMRKMEDVLVGSYLKLSTLGS